MLSKRRLIKTFKYDPQEIPALVAFQSYFKNTNTFWTYISEKTWEKFHKYTQNKSSSPF